MMNNLRCNNRGLRCSNLQSDSLRYDFVLLQIFYEGVACIIKSWDKIF